MGRRAEELGPLAVKNLTAPGLHFVGGVAGLALQVLPGGGRSWILRVVIGDRRRDMGLGGYPSVTLAGAREAAREARDLIKRGIDPIEQAKAAKSALKASAAKVWTFRAAAEAYMADNASGWSNPRHAAQWTATLKNYAYPKIGDLSVRDIEVAHVLEILRPIWTTKTETASRLRGRIEVVLDWCKARKYLDGENPARWRGHLDKLLPKPSKVAKPKHHAALPMDDMAAFMTRLRSAEGQGARALEFAILTAARSGEVRGAKWSEIDLEKGIWTIPGERMKAGREHCVPLSRPAVDLLKGLEVMGGNDLVFPAPRGGPLSDMTLSAVMRRMNVPAVPHGFRSTFRDWCSERTTFPHEVQEMALAHTVSDKTERAYRRGDLFEKRRKLADQWATFLSQPTRSGGNVTPIRKRA